MQTFISPPWRTCSQCHDDPLLAGISASRHFGQSSARQLSAPSEGDIQSLGFAQNPAARRGHSFVLACALVSMVASLYARRGRALSGAEVDRITECHTVLVLGSVLVPLGLFLGAFNRRAAGVLVSPELPPGYYPMDKSRGIEPRSRRCPTSTSEPDLNRHFFVSGGCLPAGGQSPQFWPLQYLASHPLF